jgi:hypothetical protein
MLAPQAPALATAAAPVGGNEIALRLCDCYASATAQQRCGARGPRHLRPQGALTPQLTRRARPRAAARASCPTT